MEREKGMDYISKIYVAPIRDAAAAMDVVKPHKQEAKEEKGGASGRGKVSRALQSSLKVVTNEEKVQVTVSDYFHLFSSQYHVRPVTSLCRCYKLYMYVVQICIYQYHKVPTLVYIVYSTAKLMYGLKNFLLTHNACMCIFP